MSVLDQIRAALSQQKQTAISSYRDLVKAVATDKEIDPSKASTILDAANKSADDLERDAAVVRERLSMRKAIANAAKMELEIPTIKRQIAEAQAKLDAAQSAFEETTDPLFYRLDQIKQESIATGGYQQTLLRECVNEELTAEYREVCSKLEELQEQWAELRRESGRHGDSAQKRIESRLKELDIMQPDLLKRRDEIEKRMIEF